MKRIISLILTLVLVLSMTFVGCAFAEEAETRVVVDMAGNEVVVPVKPQRVAVLPDAMCTLSWILMGGTDNMACITESSKGHWTNGLGQYIYPEMADIPVGAEQNVEELMTLDPDLIITMSGDPYADLTAAYVELGLPVYTVTSEALYGDPIACISALGELYGCEERANQLIAYMNETDAYIDDVLADVEAGSGPRMYNTVWIKDMKAWTAGSFNGKIIDALKCQNISDDPASSTAFTMEEILAYDPEIIIISFDDKTPEDFYNNNIEGQDWTSTTAVKNHAVYSGPSMVQRWAQSFSAEKFLYKRWMASVVYPDLFPMSETEAYIKAYLSDFYGYEIPDDVYAACMCTELNGI